MKQNLLKAGLLIFSLALIINVHLKQNTYYYIKGDLKTELISDNNLTNEEIDKVFPIPCKKYLSKEEYYSVLNANNGYIQQRIMSFTERSIKPFEYSQSLIITIVLCFAIGLIIIAIDFKTLSNKIKLLLIATPLIFFIFLNRDVSNSNLTSSKANLDGVENDISILKRRYELFAIIPII